ncbi:MAG: DUF1987 domain-containing protein [Bacteroidales bacterium]|nr:DUF1987 domain-containing protein [Bacteroidales bacterium]
MKVKELKIEEKHNAPEIDFNPVSGELILKGKSIPENATSLYQPVINWVKEYIMEAAEQTNLHINLIYFNTASSIWISKLVKALSTINDFEKLLIIHLYFHIEEFDEMIDEDIKDAIAPATDVLNDATVSIGVKIYGTDDDGIILNEKLVLF